MPTKAFRILQFLHLANDIGRFKSGGTFCNFFKLKYSICTIQTKKIQLQKFLQNELIHETRTQIKNCNIRKTDCSLVRMPSGDPSDNYPPKRLNHFSTVLNFIEMVSYSIY